MNQHMLNFNFLPDVRWNHSDTEIEEHFKNCIESLQAYIEFGRPVGSFLEAVISNDLKESVIRADDLNIHLLPKYVEWLYNNAPIAPTAAWGSSEIYQTWIEVKQNEKNKKK